MLAALLLQAAAAIAPPANVDALPPLPLVHRRVSDDAATSLYVRDEVRSGRCAVPPTVDAGRHTLTVDLAVFVTDAGTVRSIRPWAIGCAGVEQYAVGVASRLVRGNVAATGDDGWYRMPVTFAWTP